MLKLNKREVKMENLNKYIEHTLLKQDATLEDFVKLFNEAKENKFLGVCVNPAYVALAKVMNKISEIKNHSRN